MSSAIWPGALAFVWRPENDGEGFHRDPDDRGGDTNKGVIGTTWADAVAHGLVSGDLASATDADLERVLRVKFWMAVGCDRMAAGVDLAVFNLAMVSGVGRAAYIFQACVGAQQDGHIGPITLGLAAGIPAGKLIDALTDTEESFYSKCPTAWKFLGGWTRRAEDCRREARRIALGDF